MDIPTKSSMTQSPSLVQAQAHLPAEVDLQPCWPINSIQHRYSLTVNRVFWTMYHIYMNNEEINFQFPSPFKKLKCEHLKVMIFKSMASLSGD